MDIGQKIERLRSLSEQMPADGRPELLLSVVAATGSDDIAQRHAALDVWASWGHGGEMLAALPCHDQRVMLLIVIDCVRLALPFAPVGDDRAAAALSAAESWVQHGGSGERARAADAAVTASRAAVWAPTPSAAALADGAADCARLAARGLVLSQDCAAAVRWPVDAWAWSLPASSSREEVEQTRREVERWTALRVLARIPDPSLR